MSSPSPEDRLQKLDERVAKLEKKPKDLWDILQSIGSIVSGVLVVVAGVYLKDSLDRQFQEKQLQFSNATEMRELLTTLSEGDAAKSEAAATTLAVYGRYAIGPLLGVIEKRNSVTMAAAVTGLRTVAVAEPKALCTEMERVLSNESRAYYWKTHEYAIELVAHAGCRDLTPLLRGYRQSMTAPAQSNEEHRYRDDSKLTDDEWGAIGKSLDRAIAILSRKRP